MGFSRQEYWNGVPWPSANKCVSTGFFLVTEVGYETLEIDFERACHIGWIYTVSRLGSQDSMYTSSEGYENLLWPSDLLSVHDLLTDLAFFLSLVSFWVFLNTRKLILEKKKKKLKILCLTFHEMQLSSKRQELKHILPENIVKWL